jgi:hypothetical protein
MINSQEENFINLSNLYNNSIMIEKVKNESATEINLTLDDKYFGKCRSVVDFEKIEEIGEGTYGRVCKNL